jgi:hypothetical protein
MTAPGRDRKGRFVKTLEGAERDAEACRMRADAQSYQTISDHLGYGHASNARRAVEAMLRDTVADDVATLRALVLERLDRAERAVLEVMRTRHLTVSHGRVIKVPDPDAPPDDPDREVPLLDDGPVLQAVDRLLKIAQRRSALLGLDAPTKIQTDGTVKYTVEGIDVEALR